MPRMDERELAAVAAKIQIQQLLGPPSGQTGWLAVFNLAYQIGTAEDPFLYVSPDAVQAARKLKAEHESRIVKPEMQVVVGGKR